MNIKHFYCEFDGCWYLLSSSHLEHRIHPEEHPDTDLLNEADLSENQFNYMRLMYEKVLPSNNCQYNVRVPE